MNLRINRTIESDTHHVISQQIVPRRSNLINESDLRAQLQYSSRSSQHIEANRNTSFQIATYRTKS